MYHIEFVNYGSVFDNYACSLRNFSHPLDKALEVCYYNNAPSNQARTWRVRNQPPSKWKLKSTGR
jgi:hypothetical protein